MRIVYDFQEFVPLARLAVERFGYAPEHNIDHWLYTAADHDAPFFASFEDGSAILAFRSGSTRYVFSEPVAPEPRRAAVLSEFISAMLRDEAAKKVSLELHYRTRHNLLRALPAGTRACEINYTLTWPVFDLAVFDPTLPGGRYKDLRNARNAFYRDHQVEIVDARDADRGAMRSIPDAWEERRRASDRAYTGIYRAYIESGFVGCTDARVLVVDGRVCGINAGWAMPNSTMYYAAIGLHDYSAKDLGDMLNLEDLARLKHKGYSHADFAGGEAALTKYKLKFGDATMYKSFIFSVIRA